MTAKGIADGVLRLLGDSGLAARLTERSGPAEDPSLRPRRAFFELIGIL